MRWLALVLMLLPALAWADMFQDASNAKQPEARTNLGISTFNPVADHAAPIDGTTDATAAVNASIADCAAAGAGRIYIPGYQFKVSANLTIPANCILTGDLSPFPGDVSVWNVVPAIRIDPAYRVTIDSHAGMEGIAVIQAGIVAPANVREALAIEGQFAGTGVRLSNGSMIRKSAIIGFGRGLLVDGSNFSIDSMQIDSKNCIEYTNIFNWSYSTNIACHPYGTTGVGNSITTNITSVADNGSGVIRLTVGDATNFVNGDVANMYQVTGFSGAIGKCVINKIDTTHVDCTGTIAAPVKTSSYTIGSKALHVADIQNVGIGQAVAGAGIPGATTVLAIDQWQLVVYVNNAVTSTQAGTPVTFTNGASIPSGTLSISPLVRHDAAYRFGSGSGTEMVNVDEFGHEIGFDLQSGANWVHLVSANCDGVGNYDPANICVKSAGRNLSWRGGNVYIPTMTAFYGSQSNNNSKTNITGVYLAGHNNAAGQFNPYVSLSLAGSSVAATTLTGVSGGTVGPSYMSIANGAGNIHISGSALGQTTPLFDDPATAAKVLVDQASALGLRPSLTVASLPTCNAAAKYTTYQVSDAAAPAWNATVAGAGVIAVPVMCDGAAWKVR